MSLVQIPSLNSELEDSVFPWESHSQLIRPSGFDPKGTEQAKFSASRVAIIGGGTVGYSVLSALLRSGAALEGGAIQLWQGADRVGPENLHSAFTREDIGRLKSDVLVDLHRQIQPDANVRIVPRYMENPAEVFAFRPDVVVSAFDSPYGFAALHLAAVVQQSRGLHTAPIVLGTDLGRGGVSVEAFRYDRDADLFNGHVDKHLVTGVINIGNKSKEQCSPQENMMRTMLLFQAVGLQNLPSDMLQSLVNMVRAAKRGENTGSFAQSPFSGLVVGPYVAQYIYQMANGADLRELVYIDARNNMLSDKALAAERAHRAELLQVLQAEMSGK